MSTMMKVTVGIVVTCTICCVGFITAGMKWMDRQNEKKEKIVREIKNKKTESTSPEEGAA